MTVAELREQLATLPDEAEVVAYHAGGGWLYDCYGPGEPHEGVAEALEGTLWEGQPVVVLYVG